ncbi:helix-turn-helix domain-containing protein [Microbispora corallina]|uniref:Transcriptional regulator family protein n=1 Tax=Microbispora corallina TaxID=83302 RepID=A0ABQ4G190_9ACTN|nr:helix-turn-helix domain-containing protein [Microbispora corallina]GIH40839.1 transcriptional regulator family protein [Microbispora corallina]
MTELLDERDAWLTTNCSIARAFDVIRHRSTLLLLREASFGTRRFDDFARRVGVSEPAAAMRLKGLVAEGLLERRPYQEPGQRTRDEYVLTRKGRELLPVLSALRQWGDTWAADPAGPSIVTEHRDCGAPVRLRLRCEAGHDVQSDEVELRAGPGLVRAPGDSVPAEQAPMDDASA